MKRKFIIFITIIAMILSCITVVQAASTTTVTMKASKNQVKAGETFTVTISGQCVDGINGIDTTYSYDQKVLELQKAEVADSAKWSSIGNGNSVTVICNSEDKITDSSIYVLTFKIKEGIAVGTETIISTTDIMLDSDSATNSVITLGAQNVKVTVAEKTEENPKDDVVLKEIKVESEPTKKEYKEGEEFDKTGMKIIAVYSDGTTKEITDYKYLPDGKLSKTDKVITITYSEDKVTKTVEQKITVTEKDTQSNNNNNNSNNNNNNNNNNNKKDDTTANKNLNYAGVETYMVVVVLAIAGLATIFYIKCKKYKNI